MKKILLIGYFPKNLDQYSYSQSFYNKFLKLGYKVEKFNYRKKNFFISKLNSLFINFLLLKKVKFFKPDLIFFIKAENIYSKTIKLLKTENITLVNFYPDNPFVFWNGNSNKDVLNSLPFYDCFLSWSKQLMPILKQAGAKDVYYFPFAFDEDIYNSNLVLNEEDFKKYKCDVCFAGTWDKEREYWLTELIKKMPNLNLAIWGNLWKEKLSKDSVLINCLKGSAIYKNDIIKLFKTSKIVLNFIRKQNETSHNMRTLEVPATKSFLLTQRTVEQAKELFKEGQSIECFNSIEELIKKIKFYLDNDDLRRSVAQNGYNRAQRFELKIVLNEFMKYIQGKV
jgi:spore maturation protein CgeB